MATKGSGTGGDRAGCPWGQAGRVAEGEEESAWLGSHHFLMLHLIFPPSFVSLLCSFVLHANLLFYYLWRWLHNTIKEKKSTLPTCSVVLALLTVFCKSVFNWNGTLGCYFGRLQDCSVLLSTELFLDLFRLPEFVALFDALCFVFMSKSK